MRKTDIKYGTLYEWNSHPTRKWGGRSRGIAILLPCSATWPNGQAQEVLDERRDEVQRMAAKDQDITLAGARQLSDPYLQGYDPLFDAALDLKRQTPYRGDKGKVIALVRSIPEYEDIEDDAEVRRVLEAAPFRLPDQTLAEAIAQVMAETKEGRSYWKSPEEVADLRWTQANGWRFTQTKTRCFIQPWDEHIDQVIKDREVRRKHQRERELERIEAITKSATIEERVRARFGDDCPLLKPVTGYRDEPNGTWLFDADGDLQRYGYRVGDEWLEHLIWMLDRLDGVK